jgi:hypothetical protein
MASLNEMAIEALRNPPNFGLKQGKLDFTETYLVGTFLSDVVSPLFNLDVDNAILTMTPNQPQAYDSYMSTLINHDLNTMENVTVGRFFNTVYRLSDKFFDASVTYYKGDNTNGPVFVRVERNDGLILIILQVVDELNCATVQDYLVKNIDERILCMIVYDTSEASWETVHPDLILIRGVEKTSEIDMKFLITRSAANFAAYKGGVINGCLTLYYKSNKVFSPADFTPAEITGTIYKLSVISAADAFNLMPKFYGFQDFNGR